MESDFRALLVGKGFSPPKPNRLAIEWDRAEQQRLIELDPFRIIEGDTAKLRKRFFPRLAETRLERPHTKVGAAQLDSPGDLATLLLFFETILVEACPVCLTSKQLSNLSLLLQRGLAVPLLMTPYSMFQSSVVDVLATHQEEIISSHANAWYRRVSSAGSLVELHNREHVLGPKISNLLRNAPRPLKSNIRSIKNDISMIPSAIGTRLVSALENAIAQEDFRGLSRMALQADAVSTLESSRVYSTTPLVDLESPIAKSEMVSDIIPEVRPMIKEVAEFSARGLQVAWTPDIPLEEYLDIVSGYRGRLTDVLPVASRKSIGSAFSTVSRLNREIEEVSRSRKYRWGRIPINVMKTPKLIGMLIRLALGHGAERILSEIHSSAISTRRDVRERHNIPSLSERTLSRIFSKEVPVVQLWGLRRSLARATKEAHSMSNRVSTKQT